VKIADFGLARIYRDAMALTSVVSDSVRRTSTETLVIFTVILLFYLCGVKYITDVSTTIIVRSLLFLLGGGGGGGHSWEFLVVVCHPVLQILTQYFRLKNVIFHTHFQTWPQLFKYWIALATA